MYMYVLCSLASRGEIMIQHRRGKFIYPLQKSSVPNLFLVCVPVLPKLYQNFAAMQTDLYRLSGNPGD